ncbi:type II secretion system protein GspG [uncultured Paludibaculum sp.]|uniref:type II secretion system protein GspG n=1 Tax=uncultured Paludibaculum sp. TaxID=1765020 RepID=UPI00374C950A
MAVRRSRVSAVVVLGIAGIVACWHWMRGPDCQLRVPADQAQKNSILVALEAFRLDTGRYPTTEEGLISLLYDPSVERWRGPYLPANSAAFLHGFSYSSRDGRRDVRLELRRLH